jgi:sterol desaturase/sphingolipid hydroxylase (fatty acid hydroxylase superfamily)
MTDLASGNRRSFAYRQTALAALLAGAMLLYMFRIHGPVFWNFMLTAYGLGILIYFWEKRHHPELAKTSCIDYLFPKTIWLHRSSLDDGLIALIFYGTAILPLIGRPSIWQAVRTSMFHAPIFHATAAAGPAFGIMIFYTLLSIMVADLFYYVSHRLMHTIPFLWEFHKVHHSAEVLTPLTMYRMHPVDGLFTAMARELGVALTGLIFLYFYPHATTVKLIAGIGVMTFVSTFTNVSLRHSHIWLSFGSAIEHVFISPAQHQIHHSIERKHINKNYGSIFSLWDWMFNSLYVPQGRETITFGLGGYEPETRYQTVVDLLVGPFLSPFKKFAARLPRSGLRPDLLAQQIDRHEAAAAVGIEAPEGPAVTSR